MHQHPYLELRASEQMIAISLDTTLQTLSHAHYVRSWETASSLGVLGPAEKRTLKCYREIGLGKIILLKTWTSKPQADISNANW